MIDSFEAVALRPSIIRQQWLPLKVAMQEIVEFGKRFGLEHILLACHAALLSNLTPELINIVRINFLNYRGIDCPWIAEADFLLSPLCRSVDDTLFEVEPMVRELLLTELERRYGWQRLQEVAAFLLQYLKTSQNPKEHPGVAQVQEWIAYSYLQPDKVVQELTELLEQSIAPGKDAHVSQYEKLQLATTMETVAGPLKNTALQQGYQHLIHSTRAFARFLYGGKDLPPLASTAEQPALIDGANLTTLFPSGVQQWLKSIAPAATKPTSIKIPPTEPAPPVEIMKPPTIGTEVERLLTLAGWIIQDYAHADIRSAHGVAIRDFPTRTGETESIDYLLFVDQQAAGVIFVMEEGQNRIGLEEATSLSSRTPMLRGEKPRRDPISFTYETNAQGTLIRFTSYLDPVTRTRSVFAFHRPETFALWLQQAPPDVAKSRTDLLRARLRRMPSLSREGLWDEQYEEITNLEKSLAENRPRALIQMATGSRDILIDGYNVIKNSPAFRAVELKSLAEARSLLLRQLQNRYVRTTQRVIVVFDGNGKSEQVSHEQHIRIIYSRYGEAADTVIKRLAAEARAAGRAVEIYSDDEEVRHSVAEHGGTIQTMKQLVKQVNAAPSDIEGTSSTTMMLNIMYRLLKFGNAQCILYLTDRSELIQQMLQALEHYAPSDDERVFTDIYSAQHLSSTIFYPQASVCVSTVQKIYTSLSRQESKDGIIHKPVISTKQFARSLKSLSKPMQRIVEEKISLLQQNKTHPSLNIHRVLRGKNKNMWICYIGSSIRLLYNIQDDVIYLQDIGSHNIIDRPTEGTHSNDATYQPTISAQSNVVQYNPHLPIDAFDIIIYNPDRDITENARSVLTYFDAFLIGLTEREDQRIYGFFNRGMGDNRYAADGDVLVDGYNIIKNNLMFRSAELKSLADARALLLRQLQNRYGRTTQRVIVVFDGNDTREQERYETHVRVIFSRYGETADSVIKRLAADAHAAGRRVVMYSDDEEVRYSVAEQGGAIQSTKQLVKHVNAAPADMEARSRHRQQMRRIYGIDTPYKLEDELEPAKPQRRKKKKKSSRRR